MEKVVIAHSMSWLGDGDVAHVNRELANGWTVKSVTTVRSESDVTAIFVLEKN